MERGRVSPFVFFYANSMQLIRLILLAGWILAPCLAKAAEAEFRPDTSPVMEHATTAHEEVEHHGLPPAAVDLWEGVPITNSMVVTWGVALFLIVFAQFATRNLKQVPEGVQNFWEWLVESLYEFLESIIGHELVQKTFWFFATIFIFILFANWFGLIPGVGTIGWGVNGAHGFQIPGVGTIGWGGEHGFHITQPLLRGANADLNMTFAMAVIFFAMWTVWALQANGPGGFLMHIFGPKGETTGLLKALMIAVCLVVGVLEVVSILFRPVSLSFRLYGNIFAGENMLESMAVISDNFFFQCLIPIPFYFLEVLVGLVQALVFMLLTSVFTLLICTHEESHEKGQH